MRKIKEVLSLRFRLGLRQNQIARSCSIKRRFIVISRKPRRRFELAAARGSPQHAGLRRWTLSPRIYCDPIEASGRQVSLLDQVHHRKRNRWRVCAALVFPHETGESASEWGAVPKGRRYRTNHKPDVALTQLVVISPSLRFRWQKVNKHRCVQGTCSVQSEVN